MKQLLYGVLAAALMTFPLAAQDKPNQKPDKPPGKPGSSKPDKPPSGKPPGDKPPGDKKPPAGKPPIGKPPGDKPPGDQKPPAGKTVILPRLLNIAAVSGGVVTAGDTSGPKIKFKPSSEIAKNLFVGQSVWVEGNKATVVVFPIEMRRRTDLGSADKMETMVRVSNTGIIAGRTRTWTAEALRGFHGAVKVYIRDERGNDLYITQHRRYGVNGTTMGNSDRTETWEERMPAANVGKVRSIAIVQLRSPQSSWDASVAMIRDVLELAKTASEIYSNVAGASGSRGSPADVPAVPR